MAVTIRTDDATRVVEIVVDGKVRDADWTGIVPQVARFMETHGTIRLLEIVEAYAGFDHGLIWKGIRFDMQAIPHISHCAVVSDIPWISPLARAASTVTPMQVRSFPLDQVDRARAWIGSVDAASADG